jgi:hypothetical protein
MKSIALVSVDCGTGTAKRYWREAGNRPRETGRAKVGEVDLSRFRTDWTPPEDPGPRPTSPLRTAKIARAA